MGQGIKATKWGIKQTYRRMTNGQIRWTLTDHYGETIAMGRAGTTKQARSDSGATKTKIINDRVPLRPVTGQFDKTYFTTWFHSPKVAINHGKCGK